MSSQTYPNTQTETDTDDQDLANQIEAQKKALAAVKAKGSDAGRTSPLKRIMVAWFVMTCWIVPTHLGAPYHYAVIIWCSSMIFNECIQIAMNDKKQKSVSRPMEWLMFILATYAQQPRFALHPAVMLESGWTRAKYPIVHSVLYEWHGSICLSLAIIILLWFCFNLKGGCLKYQFSRLGLAIISAYICSMNIASAHAFYQLGVFWDVFVPMVIACNDCWAYFCGRTFGRTPLIKLSPNKTLEGFVGGAVATFIMIFAFLSTIFYYRRFTCINYRLDTLPFEQITCSNIDSLEVFHDVEWHFIVKFKASVALITCLGFGVFASLVSPFAGFFASGMKRAYKIKDFADTLPGHGGFTDRFDCTVFANICMLLLLTQVLYREYLTMDILAARFQDLSATDKAQLLKWMENTLKPEMSA